MAKKEKITPAKKIRNEYQEKVENTIKQFFYPRTEMERKEKKICSVCGRPLSSENFWKNFSYANSGRIDIDGKLCTPVCKTCSQKIFDYYYSEIYDHDLAKSIQNVCIDLNFYWDEDKLNEAKEVYENNGRKLHILSEYVGAIARMGIEYLGKTYKDSPSLLRLNELLEQKNREIAEQTRKNNIEDEIPLDWSREDVMNKKKILRVYRYDPFEFENEECKKSLYRDLSDMLDDAMEDDYVKSRAALEIVRSFNKIENWRKVLLDLENNTDSEDMAENLKRIKQITDLRNAELKSITDFCRDNGFSARYAQKKAKGAGTVSGIMSQMSEKQYEPGILNQFDISTSQSIQEAANASWEAIFNQLNVAGNESYKIIQQQREMVKNSKKKLERAEEDLRLANCEIVKLKMQIKQLQRGDSDDV